MGDTAPPQGNDQFVTHALQPKARRLLVAKVLISAAVALGVAVGGAIPVTADPSTFGVLSCTCGGRPTPVIGGPAVSDEIKNGIRDGLAALMGSG
ncbi:hypothetical protein GCM10009641_20760 [Mycobacterium cookii]